MLVFKTVNDPFASNPLIPVSISPPSGVNVVLAQWGGALGEETARLLQTFVARHNAGHSANLLDVIGYVRRLIAQAGREAGVDLLSTTEAALSATEGEVAGATSVTPATASTREDLVLA